jgi:hypothetical protein
MEKTFLVITSIADDKHPVLNSIAKDATKNNIPFIVIGDTKSPEEFEIKNCDFYSIDRQKSLDFKLVKSLPFKHYARKNIGYLVAIKNGAEVIVETDDDNIPLKKFWESRERTQEAFILKEAGWVNVYKYFTKENIWPRGFALESIQEELPKVSSLQKLDCPVQQGLADENPDVDAIYRLILPLPITFNKSENVALGSNTICPFNSQNTTWFKEAFPLMYLPSYCSFRMTDIWRSFVAQRVAWTCGWSILFHNSTVRQERNDHNLMKDFSDEVVGYVNNKDIIESLSRLKLKEGVRNIGENMTRCYRKLVEMGLVAPEEMELLSNWLSDIKSLE